MTSASDRNRQTNETSRHSSPATSTQSVACWRKTLGPFTSDMPTRTFTTGRKSFVDVLPKSGGGGGGGTGGA